ncbi:triple tyrosine motif-containing protein [Capnocytophaga catalasegens]|uniref:Two component regulator three Y domain-containing protein n=1 Tax=Capnocytophaga catalasegens TaxID=1004260 RepID=A0AAV5AZM8_9FLAO|nr:triple tyrosine motif-containing protein [Capnocytophaga catalasegens]GIZ15422.1 hypothetical protein RCZ03_14220 [Capnocytophaga catalasegens]GJM51010.1 hypothetical protein RCZ15_19830 [Capnocytophaga catalasegens]GJM52195.1 hypothetical protein RCZ16_05130 [Capnocytophaga catalasegens]
MIQKKKQNRYEQKRKNLFLFILLFISGTFLGQKLPFVPFVHNYSQYQYEAGTQNWGIAQDSNGVIYIANNQGLLCFDGKKWKLYTLPENKIVRAVFVDKIFGQERIYVGSFEEFGFFYRTDSYQLVYQSLSEQLTDYPFQNDEVWSIVKYGKKLYFQTFSSYFTYDGKHIKIHKPNPSPLGIYPTPQALYMQGIEGDFYQLNNDSLELVIKQEQIYNDKIIGLFQHRDSLILTTIKNGLFSYSLKTKQLQRKKTDFDQEFSKISLNRTLITSDSLLILGSLDEGIFALDFQGKKIWHINKSNGLKNNTILGLFQDVQQNIWLALDNGISYLKPHSKLQFFDFKSDIELVEDMEVFFGKMYLASNKGVYEFYDRKLRKLPNLDSQVWFVKRFDNQLFVGHNKGTSVIDNTQHIQNLNNIGVGGTDMKKGIIHGQEVLVASSYTYLTIFKKNNQGKWIVSHSISDFSDLIQNIEIDNVGNIWANHPHKGVYRIALKEDLIHIKNKEFYEQFSENKPLKLLKLRGKIIFTDNQQFYIYNDDNQQVISYELLNKNLPNLVKTRKIVPVNDNLFWFITDKEYYAVKFKDGAYSIEDKIAFNNLLNPSSERRATIFVEQGNSYFCLNEGIALYHSMEKIIRSSTPPLVLSSLKSYDRNTDQCTSERIKDRMSFDYTKNNLVFELQYPNFSQQNYRLQYYLENYDKRWNENSSDFTITYQNIPQGKYLLKTKIINELNQEIASCKIPFEITTPWYKSAKAFVLYGFTFLAITSLFTIFYYRYKLKKKEQLFVREKAKKQRLLEKQQEEITKLRNEKLESELEHKSKALASATILNIKHDDFLKNLLQEFQCFLTENKLTKQQGNHIIQHIREHISTQDQWQMFQENFDMIHQNFFRNLKLKYANLTPADLKLCVLLRLNYSTKDIATMQGVSVRGIETARYRLRKKLNLSEEDNLTEFLITFQ